MWMRLMFEPALVGVQAMQMMVNAQAVIAMRTGGMMGLWSTAPGENSRMVREKSHAAIKSAIATQRALLSGAAPHQIIRAGLDPIASRAGKNARRLARRGPRLPGGQG